MANSIMCKMLLDEHGNIRSLDGDPGCFMTGRAEIGPGSSFLDLVQEPLRPAIFTGLQQLQTGEPTWLVGQDLTLTHGESSFIIEFQTENDAGGPSISSPMTDNR
jgi:hypothetical protein